MSIPASPPSTPGSEHSGGRSRLLWSIFLALCVLGAAVPFFAARFAYWQLLLAHVAFALIPAPALMLVDELAPIGAEWFEGLLQPLPTPAPILVSSPFPVEAVIKVIYAIVGRVQTLLRWVLRFAKWAAMAAGVGAFFYLNEPVAFLASRTELTLPRVLYATSRKHSSEVASRVAYAGDPAERREMLFGSAETTREWNLGPYEFRRFPLGRVFVWLHAAESPSAAPRIREIREIAVDDFASEAGRRIGASGQRDALIFVHGFNTAFDGALERMSQLADDLKFEGAPILFSWPSAGSVTAYEHDSEQAKPAIQELNSVIDLVLNGSPSEVNVLAHSMGGRILVQAILARPATAQARLQNLVLFAPDVDLETFSEFPRASTMWAARTTVYVSQWDVALASSAAKNLANRVGRLRRSYNTIDVIDTRGLDTNFVRGSGHGYVFDSETVLRDYFELIRSRKSPAERALLRQSPADQVWDFLSRPQ